LKHDLRTATSTGSVADSDQPMPVFDALVQRVEITDRREVAAADLAALVEEIVGHRDRWGITSYVVRADAIDAVAPLLPRLRQISPRRT
jgi:hypothetical protein